VEGETERVELVEVGTELDTDTGVGTGRLELAETCIADTDGCGVAVALVVTRGGTILAVLKVG